MGQKSNFPAIALGLSLAMAAPIWGAIVWNGSVDGLWNTPGNWTGSGGGRDILNGDSVTLSGTAGTSSTLEVANNSTLNISTDLTMTDDLLIDSGGEVTMTAGTLDINVGSSGDKIKIADAAAPGSFFMTGGTVVLGDKLEIYSGGLLEISGGNLAANNQIEFQGGTIRVNGSWTGTGDLIYVGRSVIVGNGTYEFNPTVGGEITPITTVDGVAVSASGKLNVNLDASTTSGSMTLFQGGEVDAFDTATNVTIMHGATELTEGAGLNTYSLDYGSGSGLALSFNVSAASTADPEITSISVDGTTATITMTGTDGTDYTCMSSTTLDGGFPTTETTVPASPMNTSGGTATFTVDATEGKKFYRIAE